MTTQTRVQRVASAMEQELATIIRELKDPRISPMTSVTQVELSSDLRYAKVYVSVVDDDQMEATLEAIRGALGHIRGELTRRLHLRLAPEFYVVADRSIRDGVRINRLISEVREQERSLHSGLAAVERVLSRGHRFLIMVHVRPDGDAVGSAIGLGLGLEQLGAEAEWVSAGGVPLFLRFLDGCERFKEPEQVEGRFDAAILVDCGDADRVGAAGTLLGSCAEVINIDHHHSNTGFGDTVWIEPQAAAVGEMIYQLLGELGVAMDQPIAEALYAAIVADTGGFRYENTSATTLRAAADLVARGARPARVSQAIFERRPLSALRLLSETLATLTVEDDGLFAWVQVDEETKERLGATEDDTEGLVNYPRMIAGVEVAALFEQAPPGAGSADAGQAAVRVSLRSNGWADVSEVATQFGGGGHARAAGLTVPGTLAEIAPQVRQAVHDLLRDERPLER